VEAINRYIDQTILKPEATEQDIVAFCEGVKIYRFYAACVNPCWVTFVRAELPPDIKVCSVVGFPLGASSTRAKVYAATDLIENGCDEIDMVMNIGKLKSKDFRYVGQEIRTIVRAISNKVLKVIIEACLLTDEEKKAAARIIVEKGAHFVKTSTQGRTGLVRQLVYGSCRHKTGSTLIKSKMHAQICQDGMFWTYPTQYQGFSNLPLDNS